ncbi:hypothetical protein [Tritonibacter horizontis]|uniref:Uncharacterized protein n=1 Tax=Tritonibacter horizontis TaxID=1768241 RepID=A0A132C082_9RHOB|nr:hypothetical protein [Tritonibacter horizontis]KUP93480.1 hypothetical protein TRIHO_16890 [Tritonibacter horizontis]
MNKVRLLAVGLLAALAAAEPAVAHPMPDTEITVDAAPGRLTLTIRVALSDLDLAMPEASFTDAEALTLAEAEAVGAYFGAHVKLLSADGNSLPVALDQVRLLREDDPDVGAYEEVEVTASVLADPSQTLTLVYDAVLHQIANHRAVVRASDGTPLGVIRFDLATKRANPLALQFPKTD